MGKILKRAPEKMIFIFKKSGSNYFCGKLKPNYSSNGFWSNYTWNSIKAEKLQLVGILYLSNKNLMRMYDILPITKTLKQNVFDVSKSNKINLLIKDCV